VAKGGVEGSLLDRVVSDADLPEAREQVNLRKDLRLAEVIKEILSVRDRELIFNSLVI
jgi:hypothetical protein